MSAKQGEIHEDAICYAHPRDGNRLARAGATRSVRAAAELPAKRLLQRLPAERVVPHRQVVKFDQRPENIEWADGIDRPFDVARLVVLASPAIGAARCR